MLYCISGAPRVGKSIIAKQLAIELRIKLVHTDDICNHIKQTMPAEMRSEAFLLPGFSGDPQENAQISTSHRVGLQVVSAMSLKSSLEDVVTDAFRKSESLIIEGVHLLPEFMSKWKAKFGANSMRSICIGSDDVDLVMNGIKMDEGDTNWLRESSDEVIRQVAEFSIAYSEYMFEEAQRCWIDRLERTSDFIHDVEKAIRILTY